MFRRITCVATAAVAVAAVALALAGSALAAPSTPVLASLPTYVSADQQLSWTPSVLDADGVPAFSAYEFSLFDMTLAEAKLATDPAGYNPADYTKIAYRAATLSTTAKLNGLFPAIAEYHEYFLCVRMDEVTSALGGRYSYKSCRTFVVAYPFVLPRLILDKYISINPDPGCIRCGLASYVSDDPIVYRAISTAVVRDPAPITGLRVDDRGNVAIVYG
jgi:hypothetical protein